MTHGDIYKKAYQLKVFRQFELVEELMKDWGFLGRNFVKTRVESWIITQIRHQTLVRVEDYFALPEFAENWQSYIRTKTCPVCGSQFVPKNSQEIYCSETCKGKAEYQQKKDKKKEYLKTRKDLNRKAVKNYRTKLQSQTQSGSQKKWQDWEIELLKSMGKLTKKDMVEVANRLGRSFKSVENKYYQLKKEVAV